MRSFLGFGQVPYIGAPSTRAIKLGGISAVAVPLLFQWISYGAISLPNINVLVNMDNAVCKALDQIRSVYVDNLGSDNPIYVYFPDTGYTIVAKPNSAGWYPAYTNSKTIWVIGEGFLPGNLPQTSMLIANIFMPPAVNAEIDNAVALWRASPTISRGNSIYNSSLGIPALGDQMNTPGSVALSTGATAPLWGTPYPSGFLYITDILVNVFNVLSGGAADTIGCVSIESTGIAGTLAPVFFGAPGTNNRAPPVSGTIFSMQNMQLKLDAMQTWRARVLTGTGQGGFQVFSSFTQQP